MQERFERGQQDDEQGDVGRSRQAAKRLRERAYERQVELVSEIALRCRAWSVGGQLEALGGALENLQPVSEQLVEQVAIQVGALPGSEVRVLDLELGELGLASGDDHVVARGQLVEQHRAGDTSQERRAG